MQRCDVFVGRLISHPCGAGAVRRCLGCGRPVCADHLAPQPGSDDTEGPAPKSGRCVVCAGIYEPPPAKTRVTKEEFATFTDEEFAIFDADAMTEDFALLGFDS